jgi:hypothetical protein
MYPLDVWLQLFTLRFLDFLVNPSEHLGVTA